MRRCRLRSSLVLLALVGCKPAAKLDLNVLKSPRQIDDPFSSAETASLQLRVQPSSSGVDPNVDVAEVATEISSARFKAGATLPLDVPNNLGDRAALALAFFRTPTDLQSIGRSLPFAHGAKSVSVFVGYINQMSAAPSRLTTARWGATATSLPNGKVLVAGGATGGTASAPTGISDALELYDPATGTFTPLDSTGFGERIFHAAVADSNGDVLLIGGLGAAGPRNDVVKFGSSDNSLTPLSSLPVGVYGHVAALLTVGSDAGAVLVAGGMTGSPAVATANAFVYRDGQAVQMAPMPSPHGFPQLTALPVVTGDILLSGGYDATGQPTASAAVWQPAQHAFVTPKPPGGTTLFRGTMASPRVGHVAVTFGLNNTVVFLYGGNNGSGPTAKPEVFVPEASLTGAFLDASAAGGMNGTPAENLAAVPLALGVDGALLVGGESGGAALSTVLRVRPNNPPSPITGTVAYPVSIDSPAPTMTMISPARVQGAITRVADGNVLYVGGRAGAPAVPSDAAELFVPCFEDCQAAVRLSTP